MKEKSFGVWVLAGTLLTLPLLGLAQTTLQNRTLVVNGQSGQVNIMQVNGRPYIDLETLVRIANGSLAFSDTEIIVILSGAAANGPAPAAAPSPTASAPPAAAANPPSNPGFSKGFLRAGIELMSSIREWRAALMNSVQHAYPVTEDWISSYRGESAQNLRLANVAVTTDGDRSAMQLLTNEFGFMKKLSDRYVDANKNMTYVSPDSLTNDPLNQQIVTCAHSLSAMAASGQFTDDGSCQ